MNGPGVVRASLKREAPGVCRQAPAMGDSGLGGWPAARRAQGIAACAMHALRAPDSQPARAPRSPAVHDLVFRVQHKRMRHTACAALQVQLCACRMVEGACAAWAGARAVPHRRPARAREAHGAAAPDCTQPAQAGPVRLCCVCAPARAPCCAVPARSATTEYAMLLPCSATKRLSFCGHGPCSGAAAVGVRGGEVGGG